MLVVWRSIFRFWGGGVEANKTPGSSGFPGTYTRNKGGIAGSVLMMGGFGCLVDGGSQSFFVLAQGELSR